jgi:hypothetical protein
MEIDPRDLLGFGLGLGEGIGVGVGLGAAKQVARICFRERRTATFFIICS